MWQIVNLVTDLKITTQEQARALVDEEARECAAAYNLTEGEARRRLLDQIGYVSRYYSDAEAVHLMELFETEHPILGRERPAPEDAYRMGREYAEKITERGTIDKAEDKTNNDH
jgi:hypothetical protein